MQSKQPHMTRHFAFWFMIGFWLLLGLIDLLKNYVYTISAGKTFDWAGSLQFISFYSLAWVLLSFPIYLLFRKTAHLSWPRRALWHTFGSIVFGGLHVSIVSLTYFICNDVNAPDAGFWDAYFKAVTNRFLPSWLDRTLTYWMVAIILLAFDYYDRFRRQSTVSLQLESELSQAQLQALRMQVQPHFLFNAHNTIAMLIRRGKHDAAVDMISGLSDMLRTTLTQENEQFITLKEEIELIEKYLDIEQARFEERLSVHIDIPRNAATALVPSLILQPLVENAIKHGVARQMKNAEVSISATIESDQLHVEVYNSGPALPPKWSLESSDGIGLQNVNSRLQTLYPNTSNLALKNHLKGVSAIIAIPFSNKGQS